jgi:hypothetical protein
LFIVAGLVFLGVAIVGNITGRIQPGPIGRILGGVVGPLLIIGGLTMEVAAMRATPVRAQPAQTVTAVPSSTPTQRPLRTATPTPRPVTDPKLGTKLLPTPTAKQIIDAIGN